MKKLLTLLLIFLLALSLFACGGSDVGIIGGADGPTEIIVSNQTDETTADTTLPEYDESHTGSSYEDTYADDGDAYLIDEEGWYYSAEDVALYLATYDGELPDNFITKNEARSLGWEGGSLEPFAPGHCIGGDFFGQLRRRFFELRRGGKGNKPVRRDKDLYPRAFGQAGNERRRRAARLGAHLHGKLAGRKIDRQHRVDRPDLLGRSGQRSGEKGLPLRRLESFDLFGREKPAAEEKRGRKGNEKKKPSQTTTVHNVMLFVVFG